jgi:hypothetical protein
LCIVQRDIHQRWVVLRHLNYNAVLFALYGERLISRFCFTGAGLGGRAGFLGIFGYGPIAKRACWHHKCRYDQR